MSFSRSTIEQANDEISVFLDQYRDIPVDALIRGFGVNKEAKNALNSLVIKMLRSNDTVSFAGTDQSDLIIKTIKLDKYGQLKESMSFPVFKYEDIFRETWNTSSLRSQFDDKTYTFTVFQASEKDLYLTKIILWKMPEHILDGSVRTVWERMHECVSTGKIVKYIDDNGRYFSYFPSSSENPYVHVRPHAQNREDAFPLPIPDRLTGLIRYPKHSFWLNRSYILKIISKEDE